MFREISKFIVSVMGGLLIFAGLFINKPERILSSVSLELFIAGILCWILEEIMSSLDVIQHIIKKGGSK